MNVINLIKHCKTLKQLHQIHAHITTTTVSATINPNLLLHTFTSLLSSSPHFSSSSLAYVTSLFHHLIPNPTIFSFNTLIRAHTLLLSPSSALNFFVALRRLSLPPDFHTFPFALKASSLLPDSLVITQTLHSQSLKFGLLSHSFLVNTLIHAYSASLNLRHARRVFDESLYKDLVAHNAILDALVKGGEVELAREMFDGMREKDAVSWGTVLAGYAQKGRGAEGVEMFGEMMRLGVKPDDVCLVSALSACTQTADLERGRSVHEYIRRNRTRGLSSYLLTALVDFYGKCGCIETAMETFESRSCKNVFAWNAMITGLAMHGYADLSVKYFLRMIEAGVRPDGISFLGVLVGCSHRGKVDEARKVFDEMESVYGVTRELKHYGCMADLLGRAGLIKEAMEMIEKMPMRGDVNVWGGLLGGCKIHGDVETAKTAAAHVMALDPEDGGVYSIMASVYANAEKWNDMVKTRKSISADKRVKKSSGFSSVRLNGVNHEFLAGDSLHPQTEAIYFLLDGLGKHQFESC